MVSPAIFSHLQCQRSIERANADINDMLIACLSHNSTQDWSLGLCLIQSQKNSAHHAGIKCALYSAMFGCSPKVGLKSATAAEIIERLEAEKDLLSTLLAS